MQSDVVTVTPANIAPALELVERTVTYIGYPREFGERMRLMAEELIGAIRFVLEETSATLWVNTDQTNMEIHLRLEGLLSDAARRKLVDISKCRCNEPPKGLFSRIGAFFSDAFMSDAAEYVPLFIDDGEGMRSAPFTHKIPPDSIGCSQVLQSSIECEPFHFLAYGHPLPNRTRPYVRKNCSLESSKRFSWLSISSITKTGRLPQLKLKKLIRNGLIFAGAVCMTIAPAMCMAVQRKFRPNAMDFIKLLDQRIG